ncbi:hypothetical protein CN527_10205 [Bacillus cereus]|nr:hypothetical protein CN527_10205 [Bacillus cereus]PGN92693.1 hypothetical protein CN976_23200 [Bacillus cereus]
MLQEVEGLYTLRHRWSRLTEVWTAYQTFLNREIEIGPDKICLNDVVAKQTTHTLLTVYYSYLYSLFDKSGIDFFKVIQEIEDDLTREEKNLVERIREVWLQIEKPIEMLRHNIGFHGGKKKKSLDYGYSQFDKFNPILPQTLMKYLRVFFRFMYFKYEATETMNNIPARNQTMEILSLAHAEYEATKKINLIDLFSNQDDETLEKILELLKDFKLK